jgi:hypothetical protein
MNKNVIIGVGIIAVVLIGAFIFQMNSGDEDAVFFSAGAEKVEGFIGSEKSTFLSNPEVQKFFNDRGYDVSFSKAGSIEMVGRGFGEESQFLWPSSQVALEIYQSNFGRGKSEIIFNSPIVIYTWDEVLSSLADQAYVEEQDGVWYLTKFEDFLQGIIQGKSWQDLGVKRLFGPAKIIFTDPTKSNSGNMFLGLMSNILLGELATDERISGVIPTIKSMIDNLGYLEHSTGYLFEQYLQKGMGSYPMIVGYESQIVEFALNFPEAWENLKDKLRILYPVPTVWSSHPFIAKDEASEEILNLLKDPEIQQLAWTSHGFRSGLISIQNDPSDLGMDFIPKDIDFVQNMPRFIVMEKILLELE